MKARREFDIDIFKLSNKRHQYTYDIEQSFFSDFEDTFIQNGKLHVALVLDKSEALIITEFTIKGTVELTCDRSSDNFDFPIDTVNKLIFKYGDEFLELTDEIISIPRDTQRINMAQYIYEFVGLAIPMKKLHPRFEGVQDEEDSKSETLLIYTTGADEAESESEEDKIDPRWNVLNGLKHNNN